jgi:DNA polymerase
MGVAVDAALHTFVTEHYAQPGVPESSYYMTTVTTDPITPERLAAAVAEKCTDPAQRFWYHGLTFPDMPADPGMALASLDEAYRECGRCHLSNRRTKVVNFRGNCMSPVLLWGEGPGKTEDSRGIPFCGASGRLQDKLLEGAGIPPDSLSWGNLVGCRPCNNRFSPDRVPNLVEKAACSERALMLLRALRPSVVVCLGQEPCTMFWDDAPPPWTWHSFEGGLVVGHARHPAYLLRRVTVQGGEAERVAALRFYGELRDRLPHLKKLPAWPLPIRYLGEVVGKILVGT